MAAEEPGQFIIEFADRQETNPIQVFSAHTSVIGGNAKAAPIGETRKAIPNTNEGLLIDAKTRGVLRVTFKSDVDDTIESEESQWEIPVLIFDELTKKLVTRRILTQDNMEGFTTAGTVDIVCAAGVPVRVSTFNVERGLLYGLDPRGKVRAYMGDDT